eukprot:COSAG01_NODE_11375_length_1949_cov_1.412973_3_plen_116_part_00
MLRALDLPAMQRLGLFIVDRRRLEEWLRTPRLVQMEAADVEEVLTEPERQHRYPDPTCNALRVLPHRKPPAAQRLCGQRVCQRVLPHRKPPAAQRLCGRPLRVCVCVCVCVCVYA